MNSTATSSGNGSAATTLPTTNVGGVTGPLLPNDTTSAKEQLGSADEAIEMAGSIMANMVGSEIEWNSVDRVDDRYESDGEDGDKTSKTPSSVSFGRWTREEHNAFLLGLKEYGREWKKVADMIPSRNSAQIRSHAQKYFAKLSKEGNAHPLSLESESIGKSHSVDQELNKSGLSSSVLAKIDQISRDPSGVQREVELTLKRLRERYIYLQSQLEKSRRLKDQSLEASPSSLHNSVYMPLAGPATAALNLECDLPESDFDLGAITAWTTEAPLPSSIEVNTCSRESLSSENSVVIERDTSAREFGSEELIALEVLRGGLPTGSFTKTCAAPSFSHKATMQQEGILHTRKRKINLIPESKENEKKFRNFLP